MSNIMQTGRLMPASYKTLATILETLPGALFVVDDAATIIYANINAQAITGATQEELLGKSLWRGAPQLVSTTLYQAMHKTKQSREPIEVEYLSPMTRMWLHVSSLRPLRGFCCISMRKGSQREAGRHSLQSTTSPLISWRICILVPAFSRPKGSC